TAAGTATGTVGGTLVLFATSPGQWGSNLQVSVTQQAGNPSRFSLQVIDGVSGKTLESFSNLSATATDPQYVVTVINSDSQYVTFVDPATQTSTAPGATPSNTTIPVPTQPAAPTTSTSGGTLAAGTYFYVVSALFGTREGGPSNEQSIATT